MFLIFLSTVFIPAVTTDVVVKPEFGILGSSVTLTCTINPDIPELIVWTKDQNTISDPDTVSDYSESSKTTTEEITISSLEEGDIGSYACTAYFDGWARFEASPGVPLTQLRVLSVSESQSLSAGQTTTFSCSVSQPADLPGTAVLAWNKDGSPLPGGSTRTEDTARTLTLILTSLTLSQTGSYRCTAAYPGVPGALETEDVSLFVRGWVTPLGQHHVVDGSSEALTCVVQTEAEPVVTWYIGGQEKSGAVNSYQDNIMTSIYEVKAPTSDKTVRCRATVSGVTIDTSGTIGVLRINSYTDRDITLVAGSSQEFTCVYDDVKNPSAVWYKDGVVLSPDQYSDVSSGGVKTSTLSLSDVVVDDRGSYFCLVSYPTDGNFLGGRLETFGFTVSVTASWMSPASISVVENSAARLTCSFISSQQADTIMWKTVLGSSWSDVFPEDLWTKSYSFITMVTTSVLSYPLLTSDQYGQYKCVAVYGDSSVESSTATITRTSFGFTSVSEKITSETGSAVTLTCDGIFSSATDISVTWLQDGQQATNGAPTTSDITSRSTKYHYSISVETVSDAGQYECAMSSVSRGTTVRSSIIPVYVRGFLKSPNPRLVMKGGELTLSCVVTGDTSSLTLLSWYKDDRIVSVLSFTKRFTTTVVDHTTLRYEMYVFNTAYGDAGRYMCKAKWTDDVMEIDSNKALLVPAEVSLTIAEYGIIGTSTVVDCVARVGITDADEVPHLNMYRGSSLLFQTVTPDLLEGTTDDYTATHVIESVAWSDFSDEYHCELDFGWESLRSENSSFRNVEMISSSVSQTVAYGDSLTLTCTSTLVSSMEVTASWMRNGLSLNNSYSGSSGSLYKTSLEFDTFSDFDTGSYKCAIIYSDIGTLTSSDIIVIPSVEYIQPVNKEVEAGTDTTISCLITGISRHVETVTWKKDGTDVSSLSESNYIMSVGAYESDSQNTTLTVSGAANTADSMYTCAITSNEWSQVDQEATVVLNVFDVSLEDKSVPTATAQTITCSISGLSQNTPVTWIDPDNNEISDTDTDNYVMDQGIYSLGNKSATLTITAAKISALTSGDVFKCKLRSSLYGTHSPDVIKSMTLSFLTLDVQSINKEVETETEVTISCVVTGISKQLETVMWRKDGIDVTTLSESLYIVSPGMYSSNSQTTTLTVKAAANTADSTYTCVITSDEWLVNNLETTVALGVFSVLLEDQAVSTATQQRIACSITGLSEDTLVTWIGPDESEIVDSGSADSYSIEQGIFDTGSKTSFLIIGPEQFATSSISTGDVYKCMLKSALYPIDSPEVVKKMTLTVLSLDVLPIHKEVLSGVETTISCVISGITKQLDSVVWEKGGIDVTTRLESDYVMSPGTYDSNSQTTTLNVKDFANTEDSVYTCVITSNEWLLTNMETTVILDVFDISLEDRFLSTGTDQTITCSISGLSQNTPVTWIDSDNNEISDTDTDNYVIDQGIYSLGSKYATLTITAGKISALTSGDVFKCKLRSSMYETHSPDAVQSMIVTLFTLDVQSINKEVEINTDASISCIITGITEQLDSVVWTKDGIDVTTLADSNYIVTPGIYSFNSQTTLLTVKADANTADSTYTCAITTNESIPSYREAIVALKVFTVLFEDKVVTTATDQDLVCIISGLSQNTPIIWIGPDSNEISDSETNNYVIDQGSYLSGSKTSTLTIKAATFAFLSTGDEFKCKLKSAFYPTDSPEIVKNMALKLLSLDVLPINKEVHAGVDATIACVITGITKQLDSVVWRKDGTDVKTLSPLNYLVSPGSYDSNSQTTTLTVKDVVNTEDSIYTCVITSNEWLVTDKKSYVNLNVYAIATYPLEATTVVPQTITCSIGNVKTAVRVRWRDESDREILDNQSGYSIQQGQVDGGIQQATLTINPNTLRRLAGNQSITYKCSAESLKYPESEPSPYQTVVVTFKPCLLDQKAARYYVIDSEEEYLDLFLKHKHSLKYRCSGRGGNGVGTATCNLPETVVALPECTEKKESGENEWTSGLLFVGYNSNLLIIAVCNMLTDLMS